jgi:hypothetical protein
MNHSVPFLLQSLQLQWLTSPLAQLSFLDHGRISNWAGDMGQESRSSWKNRRYMPSIYGVGAERSLSFYLSCLSFRYPLFLLSWLTSLACGRISSEAGDGETENYAAIGDGKEDCVIHTFCVSMTNSPNFRLRATVSIAYFRLGLFLLRLPLYGSSTQGEQPLLNRRKGKKERSRAQAHLSPSRLLSGSMDHFS